MKIGIVTFHRAVSYGAVIQAWALQEYLLNKGYEVRIIDYRNKAVEDNYQLFSLKALFTNKSIKSFVKYLFKNSLNYSSILKRNHNFKYFIESELLLTSNSFYHSNEIPADFDVLICGSDQIWNPFLTKKFNNVYFLNFDAKKGCKRLSYAASSEKRSLILSDSDQDLLKNNLAKLNHISVRESNLIPLLKPYTEKKISTVLDPSLLINMDSYEKLNLKPIIKGRYLFVFQVLKNFKAISLAKKIARYRGLKIVQLYSGFNKFLCNRSVQSCGPKDFLSLIKYSECVVTTSFHGTTLSVVFKKDFYSINTGDANRQQSFLESLNLNDRFVSDIEKVDMDHKIDYETVNDMLSLLRRKSNIFLNKMNNE